MIKYNYTRLEGDLMYKYDSLPNEIVSQIEQDRKSGKENPFAFKDINAIRRNAGTFDSATLLRSNFIRDVDKILNCPFFIKHSFV